MRFRNTCLRRYFVDSVFPAPDSPDTMIDWESFPLRNSLRARSPMEKTRRSIQSEHLQFISKAPIGEFPRRDMIFEGAHKITFLELSIIENNGYFKKELHVKRNIQETHQLQRCEVVKFPATSLDTWLLFPECTG